MYPYESVPGRMEYIQKLFLEAGTLVHTCGNWQELISFLEKESIEYRSVAYEGASFELAMKELDTTGELYQWKQFRTASRQHAFHVDIGLGWAFAKKDLSPNDYLDSTNSLARSMILDGMGYYYALFKGRSTLKNMSLPTDLEKEELVGFDQGLGRRLWYMARGNVQDAVNLIHGFPEARHDDMFRGIGIACGYVGGSTEEELEFLKKRSTEHKVQLQLGVMLAVISRWLSDSITSSIELACQIICEQSCNELVRNLTATTNKFLYLYDSCDNDQNWFAQFKSDLLQNRL
ncbi:MAG: DUF1702 family protein [Flavisolibacter sp.]